MHGHRTTITRCTTSCDLVRPSKIILRYATMLGIAAKTKTPKTSCDDPWRLRRHATSHDYTRFTPYHRNLPIVSRLWRRKGRCDRGLIHNNRQSARVLLDVLLPSSRYILELILGGYVCELSRYIHNSWDNIVRYKPWMAYSLPYIERVKSVLRKLWRGPKKHASRHIHVYTIWSQISCNRRSTSCDFNNVYLESERNFSSRIYFLWTQTNHTTSCGAILSWEITYKPRVYINT